MNENEEFIQEFLVECEENLDQMDQDLVALEGDPRDPQRLASIFRSIHTIKGTSGFFGFSKLGAVAHDGESLLSRLRDGELILNAEITTALLQLVDAIREIMDRIGQSHQEGDGDYRAVSARLIKLAQQPSMTAKPDATVEPPAAPAELGQEPAVPEAGATTTARTDQAGAIAGQTQPVVSEPDRAESPAEPDVERAQAGERPADAPPAPDVAVVELPPREGESTVEQPTASAPTSAPLEGSIRVDVSLLDRLMNLVGELVLAHNQIRPFGETFQDHLLTNATQQLDLITSELQEGVMKTRMQPIRNILAKFPRVVRDLALANGKQVHLEMHGQDTELDRTLIEAIKDPLTHLVRNAVDHGIEHPDIRSARGKDPVGRVTLRAFHEGGLVNIEISDDGAGIDSERVRDKALERGLISRDQARGMSDRQLTQLILLPGLSTAEKVTDVSGRGVGMDVVKTNIDKIGGMMDIASRPELGTTLHIKIPLTLAIIPALVVGSGGERFAIPQASLREILTIGGNETLSRIEMVHRTPAYRLRGELLPLVDLNQVLCLDGPLIGSTTNGINVLVLHAENQRFGLVVESVHNAEEIVVKPLHKALSRLPQFSGATIMGSGRIALILDVVGLGSFVGVEARERFTEAAGLVPDDVSIPCDEYLVCESAHGRRLAVPVSDVERLEEFPVASVESSCEREVVRYGDEIMPLVSIDAAVRTPGAAGDVVRIVVHRARGKPLGLVVGRVVDVLPVEQGLDSGRRQPGIRGCTVIREQVTDVVDIAALASAAGIDLVPAVDAESRP